MSVHLGRPEVPGPANRRERPKADFGSCCVTFVKERIERIQYLQRDCSMNLVNSREKLLLIARSAALRGCSRRRGFSPDVLLLGRVFHRRPSKL
jgi:hypothetical protein